MSTDVKSKTFLNSLSAATASVAALPAISVPVTVKVTPEIFPAEVIVSLQA